MRLVFSTVKKNCVKKTVVYESLNNLKKVS